MSVIGAVYLLGRGAKSSRQSEIRKGVVRASNRGPHKRTARSPELSTAERAEENARSKSRLCSLNEKMSYSSSL